MGFHHFGMEYIEKDLQANILRNNLATKNEGVIDYNFPYELYKIDRKENNHIVIIFYKHCYIKLFVCVGVIVEIVKDKIPRSQWHI